MSAGDAVNRQGVPTKIVEDVVLDFPQPRCAHGAGSAPSRFVAAAKSTVFRHRPLLPNLLG
jgi:hypothetical protein